MAYAATQNPARVRIFPILAKPFIAFGNVLIAMAEANSRSQKLQRLMALSDAELTKHGLKRDALVHHVYSDSFYL